jgi:hypothetical protein
VPIHSSIRGAIALRAACASSGHGLRGKLASNRAGQLPCAWVINTIGERQLMTQKRRSNCSECSTELELEETLGPHRSPDGAVICDSCHRDKYQDDCARCGERVEKAALDTRPGSLIGIWRDAPALGGEIKAGYYRVLRWPFFADGMIEGYFFADALGSVGNLDAIGLRRAEDAFFDGGPMCSDCQQAVLQTTNLSAKPRLPRIKPR